MDALIGALKGIVAVYLQALDSIGGLPGIIIGIVVDLITGGRLSLMTVASRILEIEADFVGGPTSFGSLIGSLGSILVNTALNILGSLIDNLISNLISFLSCKNTLQ
jgi:hypothetical protein